VINGYGIILGFIMGNLGTPFNPSTNIIAKVLWRENNYESN
jgi:hypothetical protein